MSDLEDLAEIRAPDGQPLVVRGTGTDTLWVDAAGRVGIGIATPRARLDVASTDALALPAGTTGERPGSTVDGLLRFNTDFGQLEGWWSGSWHLLPDVSSRIGAAILADIDLSTVGANEVIVDNTDWPVVRLFVHGVGVAPFENVLFDVADRTTDAFGNTTRSYCCFTQIAPGGWRRDAQFDQGFWKTTDFENSASYPTAIDILLFNGVQSGTGSVAFIGCNWSWIWFDSQSRPLMLWGTMEGMDAFRRVKIMTSDGSNFTSGRFVVLGYG